MHHLGLPPQDILLFTFVFPEYPDEGQVKCTIPNNRSQRRMESVAVTLQLLNSLQWTSTSFFLLWLIVPIPKRQRISSSLRSNFDS
jgi:hypothetical protein